MFVNPLAPTLFVSPVLRDARVWLRSMLSILNNFCRWAKNIVLVGDVLTERRNAVALLISLESLTKIHAEPKNESRLCRLTKDQLGTA